jgi:hypothetical protein
MEAQRLYWKREVMKQRCKEVTRDAGVEKGALKRYPTPGVFGKEFGNA